MWTWPNHKLGQGKVSNIVKHFLHVWPGEMRVGGPVANLINLLPPPDCLPLSAPGSPLSPRKLWPALINVPLLPHQTGLGGGWMVDQVQSWQAASWIWILIPPTLSTLLPGLVITILQDAWRWVRSENRNDGLGHNFLLQTLHYLYFFIWTFFISFSDH